VQPITTVNDSKTIDGSGMGPLKVALHQLKAGTLYYVKAYATNNEGTGTEMKSPLILNHSHQLK